MKYECISLLKIGGVHFWSFGILVLFSCCGNQSSDPNLIILAILVKGHLGNFPVKFEWNWLSGLGGVVI